jgi:hypothetical protein
MWEGCPRMRAAGLPLLNEIEVMRIQVCGTYDGMAFSNAAMLYPISG